MDNYSNNNYESSYISKVIDEEKMLKRKKDDEENFLKDATVSKFTDKLGIIGHSLFELTLDNYNSNIAHRSVSVFTGDLVAKGMFHALCPELETFITVTDWMGSSVDRKKERVKYFQEFKRFIQEDDQDKICRIKGNYRIKRGDFATVVLYLGDIIIKEKGKRFYEWERVPFIKRSAEDFDYFMSPAFMSSVPSDEENVSEDKVSYFTLLFKVIDIYNNILKLAIYHCTNPVINEIEVTVDPKLLAELKQNTNEYYIGLFEDKIYKKNKDIHREFVLLNLSPELNGDDIAGHFITQRLYYNYLKNFNLCICTKEEFEKRCKTIFYHVKTFYNKNIMFNSEFFKNSYIDAYFIEYKGNIYYKPYIFKNLNNEEYFELLDYLEIKNKNKRDLEEQSKMMRLHSKYMKYDSYLKFINQYILCSKRNLINSINNGVEKWNV